MAILPKHNWSIAIALVWIFNIEGTLDLLNAPLRLRVLRITYGPGEKSVMHEHPAGVVVLLTDGHFKMTFPDGKTEEIPGKAGQTSWASAVKHLPENIGDKPAEVILVEMKVKPAAPEGN